MQDERHHVELVNGVMEQFKPVLDKSPQAIYVYLDDNHKACNKKFADLLGYESPKKWAETDAPLADVIEEDQPAVIEAYENASEKMLASSLAVRLKNIKTGRVIKTNLIMAPIAYSGHILVMHFLSKT